VADACLNAQESAFLTLINNYRAQNGVGPLTVSAKLNRTSYFYSYDMATRDYFPQDHTTLSPIPSWLGGPQFFDRIHLQGYNYTSAAENISAGTNRDTAQEAFDAWKNSPGHNANMLNPAFTQIGIGMAYGANSTYGYYWTTDFATGENDPAGCQPGA
jgi:uncharacterized protein YkwD